MGYFPLRIREMDSGKEYVVNYPEDIPHGVSFKVLKCNIVDKDADEPLIVKELK